MVDPSKEIFFTVAYGQKYLGLVETLVRSLMLFSTRKIIVFAGDCEEALSFDGKYSNLEVIYFQTNTKIKESKRTALTGLPLLAVFHKIEKTLEMLNKNYSNFFFIDSDAFATKFIDNVWHEDVNDLNYPLLSKHIFDYIFLTTIENNKKIVYNDYPTSTTIKDLPPPRPYEAPLMKRMGVEKRSDVFYGISAFYLFNKGSENFFKDCMACFNFIWEDLKGFQQTSDSPCHDLKYPLTQHQHSDETIINIMLWKYGATRLLKPTPIWFDTIWQEKKCVSNLINYIKDPSSFDREENGGKFLKAEPSWGYVPNNLQDILAFHGNKDPEIMKYILHDYVNTGIMKI